MTKPETTEPTSGGNGPPLGLIVAVVLVLLLPVLVVVVPLAALIKWMLAKLWPDRAVAWLLVVVGASSMALMVLLIDLPGAALRLFYGWWDAAWLPAGIVWPTWPLVGWLRTHWPAEPTSYDVLLVLAVSLAGAVAVGALWWRLRLQKRERDPFEGADVRRKREEVEARRRRAVTGWAQRRFHTSDHAVVRAVAAPIAVRKVGDEWGPYFGIYQKGDLGGEWRHPIHRKRADRLWRHGQLVRVPIAAPRSPVHHMAILGASGMGKSESVFNVVEWAMGRRWQTIYLTSKEPPTRAESAAPRLIAQAESLGMSSRVLRASVSPFDMMRGDADQLRNKLLAIEEWGEPFWLRVATLLLAMAIEGGDAAGYRVRGLPDIVRNLTVPMMVKIAAASPDPGLADLFASLDVTTLQGALTRYAGLAVDLRGWLGSPDRGGWAFEDADVSIIEFPTSQRPSAVVPLTRLVMQDLYTYLFDAGDRPESRRRRGPDGKPLPVMLVIEETSSFDRDPIISARFRDLIDRARSTGTFVVLTAQHPSGLGDQGTQESVFTSAVTVTYRQTVGAETIASVAGTGRVDEGSVTYDEHGHGSGGSVRRQNEFLFGGVQNVRKLPHFEGLMTSGGEWVQFTATMGHRGYVKPSGDLPWIGAALPEVADEPEPERRELPGAWQ